MKSEEPPKPISEKDNKRTTIEISDFLLCLMVNINVLLFRLLKFSCIQIQAIL